MSEPTAVMAPTSPSRRIDTIDILRGFTLFGVLLANMAVFSIPGSISGQGPNYWQDPVDKAVQLLVMFLAIGEFYVPFSFLFGWAMAVQMDRAAALGTRYLPLYLRRIVVLFLMGLAHAIFVWYGDVLATYAVLGLPLILFRKLSNRVILAVAIICLLIPSILYLPGPTAQVRQDYNQNAAGLYREAGAGELVYATGTYVEITEQRVKDAKAYWAGIIYWGPYVFGLFLLGLYVGRRGLLRHIEDHLPLFRRAFLIGLGVGLPLTVVYVLMRLSPGLVPADWQPFVGRTFRTFGGLGLCTFYLSAIILLTQKESWRERLAFLVPVGRMTLTNYLTQSLVCTLIFYGYGLALYNRTGPAIGLIFTVLIFAAQARFSAWWLDRYRFGPMEWLWRTLTYLKPQPMYQEGDEPPPRPSRIAVLGTVALVLVVAAGACGWWWTHQENGPPQVSIQLPQIQSTAVPTTVPVSTPMPSPTPIATPAVQPVVRDPGPAAAQGNLWALGLAFDEEQAFAEIEVLTSPRYQGRQAGSPGELAAGDYIAQRFADVGLQPAGLDGTYFQPFPVLYTTLADTPELVVTGPTGVRCAYTFRQDFATFVRYYAGAGAGEGPVIWVYNGAHDDYDGVNAVGKVVLCREGGTREDQARNALEHGAVGLLLLADTNQRPLDFVGPNRDVWVPVPIPVLRVSPPVAQDLLAGTGLDLDDLTLHFSSLPLSTTARLAVNLLTDEAAPGRNVLGVLPGRDPEYADQIVIVGGHYDHMGQDPGGTYWPGANDDASGVATVIEIARSWQEQGYVPRRTVLFAAWDAEEVGLVGSAYYVQHPRYPLTATVGMIQLDMVGAGGDTLYIEGSAVLNSKLEAIAHTLGISTTTSTQVSGSDHVPFDQAGVQVTLPIWLGMNASDVPDYHRPSDTPATIDPAKLGGAGRVTDLGLLALVEGEMALTDLLQARATAVRVNDEAAYLDTSSPARQAFDRDQFTALQALNPVRFDLGVSSLTVVGNVATGTVQMSVGYVVTANVTSSGASVTSSGSSVTATRSARLPVRFTHADDHWMWDGPALDWAPVTTTVAYFPVAYPPNRDVGDLGRESASRYITITRQLGLPTHTDAALMLYPSQQALWADTIFPEPSTGGVWFDTTGDRTLVKLVAGGQVHTDTLTHLALVQAGVTEDTAPWLWRGLPLALAASTA
ncbi:MAG: M20/M25/M40 family metallo-hydrolase, partial [Chloroflexi bacterium]|nr:M20/M25/M40 family metallo-hydrolase [Chloroflexota bacterium]